MLFHCSIPILYRVYIEEKINTFLFFIAVYDQVLSFNYKVTVTFFIYDDPIITFPICKPKITS